MKTVVFVVGMHRSGTSAVARVLALCGAALPHHIMRANHGNPTGYWEPARAVALDDQVLDALGSRWDDPKAVAFEHLAAEQREWFTERAAVILREGFAAGEIVVLKDPRVTLLLPMWLDAAERCGMRSVAVMAYRRAADVAASLARRDGMPAEQARRLWLNYCLAGERGIAALPHAFVEYGDLLANWERVIRRIADRLELALAVTADVRAEVAEFLRPDESPSPLPSAEVDRYDAVVARVFAELIAAERRGADRGIFDELARRTASLDAVETPT